MTVTVVECFDIKLDQDDTTRSVLPYKMFGSTDEDEVLDALAAALSDFYRLMPLRKISGVEHLGGGVWKADAEYYYDAGTDSTPSFTFDTTSGTSHITQSLSTIAKYPASGITSPDFKGAIGVTKDAIEGVDIITPVYRWSEQFHFLATTVDNAFKATVFNLTGKYNNNTFRGFDAYEVLFEGVRGQQRGTGLWELNFYFAASPNATGLTVGSITGINKKGWEYLWVRYGEFADASVLVRRPICVIIEQVYEPGDFSLLGIGTT